MVQGYSTARYVLNEHGIVPPVRGRQDQWSADIPMSYRRVDTWAISCTILQRGVTRKLATAL